MKCDSVNVKSSAQGMVAGPTVSSVFSIVCLYGEHFEFLSHKFNLMRRRKKSYKLSHVWATW